MSISDIIQVIAVCASVAAVVVGIFAIIQAQIQTREALAESQAQTIANQKQIQTALAESQAQAMASQQIAQAALAEIRTQTLKMLYAQIRPLLTPKTPLPLVNNDLKWDAQHCTVTIRNMGTGVALNIWGVLLPPQKEETSDLPAQYCLRAHAPISQEDQAIDTYFIKGEKLFSGDEIIENLDETSEHYCLRPSAVDDDLDRRYGYVARLTLTYRDVFGRKHASIYDHTDRHRWKCVAHLDNIRSDLEDMHMPLSSLHNIERQETIKHPASISTHM